MDTLDYGSCDVAEKDDKRTLKGKSTYFSKFGVSLDLNGR